MPGAGGAAPDGAGDASKREHERGMASFKPLATLLAGPVAGVCSKFVTYPSDTIKARLQVQGALGSSSPLYTGTLDAAAQMLRQEGPRAFYRGFGMVAAGNVPANMAYFGGYELGKWLLPDRSGVLSNMATGAIAQLSGGLMFTPVDIVKERMQVQGMMKGRVSYTGSWHALKSLVHERGLTGLLQGYWATNGVWIPWSIIHIAVYEQFKGWAAEAHTGSPNGTSRAMPGDAPPWLLGCCSAASASLAALATHPVDVIKTRLQVMNMSGGDARLTAFSVAKQALQQEGLKAFTSGAFARILTLAPGTALSWVIYEPLMHVLQGDSQ